MAEPVAFSLSTGGAASASFTPSGPFNIDVEGTWTGSWKLQRSVLGGSWLDCLGMDGVVQTFSAPGTVAVPNVFGPVYSYRVVFARLTGTLTGTFRP